MQEKLEEIRKSMGLTREVFYELTMTQLATIRSGVVVGAKWTRGELAEIVSEGDGRAALEVLQYLDERGPRVVDWGDDRVPCESCQRLDGHSDACLARHEAESIAEERAGAARDTDIDELRGGL